MKEPCELVDSLWESMDPGSPLREALKGLPPESQRAVFLRFWENNTIEEIAKDLRVSWDHADFLIDQAIFELREFLSQILDLSEIADAG